MSTGRRRQRSQGSIEGLRQNRFGWQPGDGLQYFDEDDNEISLAEWQKQIREG